MEIQSYFTQYKCLGATYASIIEYCFTYFKKQTERALIGSCVSNSCNGSIVSRVTRCRGSK